ncbi:FAD-binding oxidoreductase [Aliiroseovarius sp. PrR006]|uniref:NAD(P)/FAD-dependent oxidoreductase n=1 Tax=Aliiroseovarius sp. PrR006 TaxID=2706883 RepID=UPI0013D554FC|nr:FAD-binding oxidoreductase [Aliiroseovarius sp. PrR006]NDW54824.1 FAD-binding oxidoreductase [Aliiroseovarius sp. PrR006]
MTQPRTDGLGLSYRDTYYTRTMEASLDASPLSDRVDADICIIGGGIAGISCAYELTKAGKSVALLEADQIAWGASGRNGGVVTPGFAASGSAIEKKLGLATAKQIFDLSREGVDIFREYTKTLALPGVGMRPGALSVSRYRDTEAMRGYARHKNDAYDYPMEYVPTEELREMVRTERYFDGVYDPQGFHAHSLNYCLGLARETQRLGGRIFENTRAVSMARQGAEHSVTTQSGSVQCKTVILCQGGMVDGFHKRLQRNLLPIGTFVTVTEPLGNLADEIIATSAAIVDTRMACDYFRITPDGRLLWGGGMTGMATEPANLEQQMRRAFTSVFPQLADVKIDATWSGLLGYARHRMPYLREMHDRIWAATGLGGHGVNVGPLVGRLIAEAIVDGGQRHTVLDPYGLTWNGSAFGPLAADTVYYWEAVKERYLEWRYG